MASRLARKKLFSRLMAALSDASKSQEVVLSRRPVTGARTFLEFFLCGAVERVNRRAERHLVDCLVGSRKKTLLAFLKRAPPLR